jgi:hypothetical protein
MSVATMDRSGISWESLTNARQYYREQFGPQSSLEHYRDWMLHEWGIVHVLGSGMYVDNDVKYTAFLLRFG